MGAMQLSQILSVAPPLRLMSQVTGVPKLQGVYRLKDESGFPLDMSYELAKENGWEIGWVEAIADAARQSIPKMEALIAEIEMLEPGKGEAAQRIFASAFAGFKRGSFHETAQAIYEKIWDK